MVVKLIKAGFLVVALLAFCPLAMSLADQVFTSPMVHRPKPVFPPPGVKHLPRVEDLVLEMANQARRARGIAPLIKDEDLRSLARTHSDDMLLRRFFSHTNPEGVSFVERISNHYRHRAHSMGENIWSSQGINPGKTYEVARKIMVDWMNSPSHRGNLLSPDFTHSGVGVSARSQTIRATQVFVGRSKAFSLLENSPSSFPAGIKNNIEGP